MKALGDARFGVLGAEHSRVLGDGCVGLFSVGFGCSALCTELRAGQVTRFVPPASAKTFGKVTTACSTPLKGCSTRAATSKRAVSAAALSPPLLPPGPPRGSAVRSTAGEEEPEEGSTCRGPAQTFTTRAFMGLKSFMRLRLQRAENPRHGDRTNCRPAWKFRTDDTRVSEL